MSILATVSQAARRSTLSKKTLARTYFATPATQFSQSQVKKQEASGSESTVHVPHESSDSDTFNPVINHVFDE
ncbi:unnamed protein product [Rhizopus stolonifer]